MKRKCNACGKEQREETRKNVRTDKFGIYWECSEGCRSTLFEPYKFQSAHPRGVRRVDIIDKKEEKNES